jgi:hypothetical protein
MQLKIVQPFNICALHAFSWGHIGPMLEPSMAVRGIYVDTPMEVGGVPKCKFQLRPDFPYDAPHAQRIHSSVVR